MMKLIVTALATVLLLQTPAKADTGNIMATIVGDLKIENAWTREAPPGAQSGSAYLTITNMGSEDDYLVGGASDFASIIEIHDMTMINNIMRMFVLSEGLKIPAGGTVTLKPGGLHIMMISLTKKFKKGDVIPITLDFKSAGRVPIHFPVSKIGAKTSTHHH